VAGVSSPLEQAIELQKYKANIERARRGVIIGRYRHDAEKLTGSAFVAIPRRGTVL
jgi:hypothetical protein